MKCSNFLPLPNNNGCTLVILYNQVLKNSRLLPFKWSWKSAGKTGDNFAVCTKPALLGESNRHHPEQILGYSLEEASWLKELSTSCPHSYCFRYFPVFLPRFLFPSWLLPDVPSVFWHCDLAKWCQICNKKQMMPSKLAAASDKNNIPLYKIHRTE